jgi:hypothetical protein
MVKADGKVVKVHNVINMMEIMLMIKRMDLVFLFGLQVILTKENIKMMKEMDMVK